MLAELHDGNRMSDQHTLGESLGPVVCEMCEGRLGQIEWFWSVWQRGGAATGFSMWRDSRLGDAPRPVMVKIPVGPVEHGWTVQLGGIEWEEFDSREACERPTPRVFASGESAGGYDLAWLVLERLPGKPLNTRGDGESFERLIRAAAKFQREAGAARPVAQPPKASDWEAHVAKAREHLRDGVVAEAQRWNEALKRVQKMVRRLAERWGERPVNAWCHGDLHLGNAMERGGGGGESACVLIDLALVHAGHWSEDALYLERQYWGHEQALCGVRPVSALARARRELGMDNGEDHSQIVNVRRVLAAACVPLLLDREGNARYVHGALEVLERVLPQLSRL